MIHCLAWYRELERSKWFLTLGVLGKSISGLLCLLHFLLSLSGRDKRTFDGHLIYVVPCLKLRRWRPRWRAVVPARWPSKLLGLLLTESRSGLSTQVFHCSVFPQPYLRKGTLDSPALGHANKVNGFSGSVISVLTQLLGEKMPPAHLDWCVYDTSQARTINQIQLLWDFGPWKEKPPPSCLCSAQKNIPPLFFPLFLYPYHNFRWPRQGILPHCQGKQIQSWSKKKLIVLFLGFIFGCAGSLLLLRLFSSCSAWSFYCGGFPFCIAWALGCMGSVVAAPRL